MRGLVVCVNYDDYLAITLPANARHMTEIVVVTTPADTATHAVVATVPSARCYKTNAFYRNSAKFNKGAAIEEAFTALGREGWILVWDADTLLPDELPLQGIKPACLYGAKRRLCEGAIPVDWHTLPLSTEAGHPGYFQLFHASALQKRPWYGVESPHAGIGDAQFQNHWRTEDKRWLPMEVLHLGPRDTNWFGRASARLDGQPTPLTVEEARIHFAKHGWKQ